MTTPFTTQYAPKGRMCAGCVHADKDCTQLDFKKMPRLFSRDGWTYVRCSEYQSRHQPNTTAPGGNRD